VWQVYQSVVESTSYVDARAPVHILVGGAGNDEMDGDAAPAPAAATGWVDPSKAVVARSNAALYKEVAGAGWLAVQDNGYFGAGLVEVFFLGGGLFFVSLEQALQQSAYTQDTKHGRPCSLVGVTNTKHLLDAFVWAATGAQRDALALFVRAHHLGGGVRRSVGRQKHARVKQTQKKESVGYAGSASSATTTPLADHFARLRNFVRTATSPRQAREIQAAVCDISHCVVRWVWLLQVLNSVLSPCGD
jgi:hypothetical protein